jgi:hypothetical protein
LGLRVGRYVARKGGRQGDVRRWRHNTQDTDELEINNHSNNINISSIFDTIN